MCGEFTVPGTATVLERGSFSTTWKEQKEDPPNGCLGQSDIIILYYTCIYLYSNLKIDRNAGNLERCII